MNNKTRIDWHRSRSWRRRLELVGALVPVWWQMSELFKAAEARIRKLALVKELGLSQPDVIAAEFDARELPSTPISKPTLLDHLRAANEGRVLPCEAMNRLQQLRLPVQ